MSIQSIHKKIFSQQTAKHLGLAHCKILFADTKLQEKARKSSKKRNGEDFNLSPVQYTSFGKEALPDFSMWWLKNNVNQIKTVKENLEKVYPSLTQLKRNSEKFQKRFEGETYENLIGALIRFLKRNSEAISHFTKVIKQFSKLDVLLPTCFFTHPEWSTTQLSDKTIKISEKPFSESQINNATEIVLGLRIRNELTYKRVKRKIQEELAASRYPTEKAPLRIPEKTLNRRVINTVLPEFSLYFEKIRICC